MTQGLEIDALRVVYGGVVAVDDVSLVVPPASIIGLIGPNGAGKTSMIDAITGYTSPASGRVLFDGDDVTSVRPSRRAQMGLGRTFQSIELFDDLTVEENLRVAATRVGIGRSIRDLFLPLRPVDDENVSWALQTCGLEDIAGRDPKSLSLGQRKLVGVARALAQKPRVVLLDEPAAGLDTGESAELGERLRSMPEKGVSVLLVDHDMSLVLGTCQQIYVLDFGKRIAKGTPAEIRSDSKVIAAYLGSQETADVS